MLRSTRLGSLLSLFTFAALLSWTNAALSHDHFEVDGTVGARFGGRASALSRNSTTGVDQAGTWVLSPGVAYGAIFGYRSKPNGFAFLSFSRAQSATRFQVDGEGNVNTGTLAIEYYQLGGNLEITRGVLVPYFGASVGLGRFAAIGEGTDRIFFSAVVDGGFKIDLHRHVHLRLLGRFPITLANDALRCMGEGSCVTLEKLTPFVQVETQLGLGVSF